MENLGLKPQYAQNATIIKHELAHVAQYERMGDETFIKRYLTELLILGYRRSMLELEAYQKQTITLLD